MPRRRHRHPPPSSPSPAPAAVDLPAVIESPPSDVVALPPVDITRAQAIRGWMSAAELTWLARTAQSAAAVIEIGCYLGRATRALGDHVAGTVFSIDPWSGAYFNDDDSVARWFRKLGQSGDDLFAQFSANLADLIAAGAVVPIRAPAAEAVAQVPASVDVVFIDGDHRYEAIRQDLATYRVRVRPGGILAGHDYGRADWPGVQRAVDEAFPAVTVVDTIWWVRL